MHYRLISIEDAFAGGEWPKHTALIKLEVLRLNLLQRIIGGSIPMNVEKEIITIYGRTDDWKTMDAKPVPKYLVRRLNKAYRVWKELNHHFISLL